MKPLIKWPGGKSREIKYIRELIPDFDRYIEPFVGGGALFFELAPNKAIINDVDDLLIKFYQSIKSENSAFRDGLNHIVNDWSALNRLVEPLFDFFTNLIHEGRKGDNTPLIVDLLLSKIDHIRRNYYLKDPFNKYLTLSVKSKIQRVINLEKKTQYRI